MTLTYWDIFKGQCSWKTWFCYELLLSFLHIVNMHILKHVIVFFRSSWSIFLECLSAQCTSQIVQVNRIKDLMWHQQNNKQTQTTPLPWTMFDSPCPWLSSDSLRHQTPWRLIPWIGSGPTVSRTHAHRTWQPNWGKPWRKVTRAPSGTWCGATHAISSAQVTIPPLCRWGQAHFLVYSVPDALFITTFSFSLWK